MTGIGVIRNENSGQYLRADKLKIHLYLSPLVIYFSWNRNWLMLFRSVRTNNLEIIFRNRYQSPCSWLNLIVWLPCADYFCIDNQSDSWLLSHISSVEFSKFYHKDNNSYKIIGYPPETPLSTSHVDLSTYNNHYLILSITWFSYKMIIRGGQGKEGQESGGSDYRKWVQRFKTSAIKH